MGPCCVPSVAWYCVAQNGTLLPVYVNMPLSMMRAGCLGASPEGFFPGTAASGKCCRSCCVRKCCRSYRPRSMPLPLLRSEFLASLQSGCLLLGGGFSSPSATACRDCDVCYLFLNPRRALFSHFNPRLSVAHVHYSGLTAIPMGPCGSWWSCRNILPRKCCLRKSAAGSAVSGSAAVPTVPGHVPSNIAQ